MLHEVIKRSVV